MKTKAVRLYGKMDLRLEEFELPKIQSGEMMVKIISDSLCMSSYKAAAQGSAHKRVPDDVAENPIMMGHEFCGTIIEVGDKWKDSFTVGDNISIQPAMSHTMRAAGYSFPYTGGNATYAIIPEEYIEAGCILKYDGDAFFYGSLSEPVSCVIGAFYAQYHTTQGSYVHKMGIVEGGNLAILAGAGPMGFGAIDYAINGPKQPSLLVVTDIDQARLERAASIYTAEDAAKKGVKLVYINTGSCENPVEKLLSYTDGKGYDDVFCMAPVRSVVEQSDAILGHDGCLNFFAGPTDTKFSATMNFYNVHYASTHIVGTSGGNTDDMKEALELMADGTMNPSGMVTHVGGLNSAVEATKNLPNIPGGKKLLYTQLDMPLTAISDFAKLGETDPVFAKLAEIVGKNNNLWCAEAEKYLLANGKPI
ncbi:MAG: zinc-binding dehydrogenase [Christensenellales bacterium]|jgi:threonine dehydrogenase-like Zn-dependent dehydrogenase